MTETAQQSPQEALYLLLAGKWVTAAISAAAELGLADKLAQRPMTVGDLAVELNCDEQALLRLVRVLGGEGLLELDVKKRLSLTAVGAELQEGRFRELAKFVGLPYMWIPWAKLYESMRASESAFEAAMGAPLFEYLDQHPEDAKTYHRAVDEFTRREARALAENFDFGKAQTVVDVGGGLGALLGELGLRYPELQNCTLFDRAAVIEQAKVGPAAEVLGSRLKCVAGDFLKEISVPADVFVVKHVLHNWQDEEAATILRHCVSSLRPGGRILIVDGILLPGLRKDQTALLDLEMFVLCGRGRERTKPEFRSLLSSAGLRLCSTHDLAGTTRLLVAEPRG